MNYKVMPDINTIEDLLQVDNHTFIIKQSAVNTSLKVNFIINLDTKEQEILFL